MTTRQLMAITELIKVSKEILYKNIYLSDKEISLMSRLGLAIIEVEDSIDDTPILGKDDVDARSLQAQI